MHCLAFGSRRPPHSHGRLLGTGATVRTSASHDRHRLPHDGIPQSTQGARLSCCRYALRRHASEHHFGFGPRLLSLMNSAPQWAHEPAMSTLSLECEQPHTQGRHGAALTVGISHGWTAKWGSTSTFATDRPDSVKSPRPVGSARLRLAVSPAETAQKNPDLRLCIEYAQCAWFDGALGRLVGAVHLSGQFWW